MTRTHFVKKSAVDKDATYNPVRTVVIAERVFVVKTTPAENRPCPHCHTKYMTRFNSGEGKCYACSRQFANIWPIVHRPVKTLAG